MIKQNQDFTTFERNLRKDVLPTKVSYEKNDFTVQHNQHKRSLSSAGILCV